MNKKTISILLICGILVFLGWKIWSDWETVIDFKWNFGLFDLTLFLIFLPLPFIFNVVAWHLVTRSQGEKISFSKNFEAWMFSNFARYLPGGIWQYPSRIFLLSKEGVSKESGIKCLVLEALFVVFVGLLIVFFVLISGGLNLSFIGAGFIIKQQVLFIFLTLLFLAFFFLLVKSQRLMSFTSQLFTSLTGKAQNVKNIQISPVWVLLLIFAYFLAFLFPGVILFLLAKGAVAITLNLLYIFVAVYTASWLLGYVAFFAPAGIGVREAALAGFLSVYMPFSVAAVVVIALRVSLIASEAIGFGLAVLLSKRRP